MAAAPAVAGARAGPHHEIGKAEEDAGDERHQQAGNDEKPDNYCARRQLDKPTARPR